MRFKIDENLPVEVAEILREIGYDALTVEEQRLRGEQDQSLASICRREQRILVTLDLDFADIRTYRPKDYPGFLVLRLKNQDKLEVLKVFRSLLPLLRSESLEGYLWIVDEDRVRIRG